MPRPHRTTRRTALLGSLASAGAVMATTGCDTDDLRPPQARARATVTPSAAAGQPTADESLVSEAVAAIRTTSAVVVAARKLQPLRRTLAPLLRDHRLHLEALDSEPGAATTSSDADEPAALTAVRTSEGQLQQQLVGFAIRAESGTLAALLASMSASIGQHLDTLAAR